MHDVLRYIAPEMAEILNKTDAAEIYEIRIRAGNILNIKTKEGIFYVQRNGRLTTCSLNAYIVTPALMNKTLQIMSRYSLYAYENELRQGYLTLPGGHRVGITGTAVLHDGNITSLRCISGLNIRIAHTCKGCAEPVLPWIRNESGIYSTLIVSPPGLGKTTLLRDLIRILSSDERFMVSVIDERSEISGSMEGQSRFDLGFCTDILTSCPKNEGILLMLRSMGPEIMAVDEIGGPGEYEILNLALNSGVALLCTMHGVSLQQILNKPSISRMLKEGMFSRIILLSGRKGPGTIEHIYEGETFRELL